MSTYEPIASQTLSTATPSVTFSSLPQNYTDLVLVISGQVSTASSFSMRVNNDSSSIYSGTVLYTDAISTVGSVRNTNQAQVDYGTTNGIGITGSGVYTPIIVNIMNYANSATFKTFIGTNRTVSGGYLGNGDITQSVNLYRSTNPITSISVFPSNSANWTTGSTFTIYGVAAGNSSAKASGGNIVTTDGTYWYHTFTSSGVFIPSQALTCDYLVVAGGGGGASTLGGGGGAGGLRSTVTATGGGGTLESALSLSANTVYQAIIGAGGSGGVPAVKGADGNNSIFSTITSNGGGAGGSQGILPSSGGSGGGGGASTGFRTGASGTANQGRAGGNGANSDSGNRGGAGGGGANTAGSDGSTSPTGGNGGAGVAVAISGSSITYAGGGGGGCGDATGTAGTGGAGGGGNGTNTNTTGGSGTVNLGAGGGGSGRGSGAASTANGGNGGSGIIVIRYAV